MPAVVVEDLRKSYGSNRAVDGISFSVDPGEIVGVLGPNGAGKTTSLEILEGHRLRDAGSVTVLGHDPGSRHGSRSFRERVGIVLQSTLLEPVMTVREVLEMTAAYYPRPRSVHEVMELVGLDQKADARVAKLSGGQRRRLDVALGIVGDPELLFLDEPTTGFDPSARREAWALVRSLTGRGTTILLTTHYMDEAQALADRVIIMARGQIVADAPPETLRRGQAELTSIHFQLPGGVAPPLQSRRVAENEFLLETDDELVALNELTGWALRHQIALTGIRIGRRSLEDVYLELTAPPSVVSNGELDTAVSAS